MGLLAKGEGRGSGEVGGEGGREYSCIAGRRRPGGLGPAGKVGVLQVGRHGGYAIVRAGRARGAAGLALRVFWNSASC